jgi:ABC-type dipeptide/oligopeptide/nickel transport system permease component
VLINGPIYDEAGYLRVIAFFIFTLIVFFAFNLLAPYDYVTTLSLALTGTEAREALRDELGLNLPIWQQYFFWLGRLAQDNLGNEFNIFGQGRPVTFTFVKNNS